MTLRNRVKRVPCQAERNGIFLAPRNDLFTAKVNLMEVFMTMCVTCLFTDSVLLTNKCTIFDVNGFFLQILCVYCLIKQKTKFRFIHLLNNICDVT